MSRARFILSGLFLGIMPSSFPSPGSLCYLRTLWSIYFAPRDVLEKGSFSQVSILILYGARNFLAWVNEALLAG